MNHPRKSRPRHSRLFNERRRLREREISRESFRYRRARVTANDILDYR